MLCWNRIVPNAWALADRRYQMQVYGLVRRYCEVIGVI